MRSVVLLFLLFAPMLPAKQLETLLTSQPTRESRIAWPVTAPLSPPDGLRPCCAFGYNLKAQALGIPVPFYQLSNVVDADRLGTHHYNDSAFNAISNLLGFGSEQLGLIYSHRGDLSISLTYAIPPTIPSSCSASCYPGWASRGIST